MEKLLIHKEYYCLKYEESDSPVFYTGEYKGLPHLYLQEISAQRALAYFKRKNYRNSSSMKVVKVFVTVEEVEENE